MVSKNRLIYIAIAIVAAIIIVDVVLSVKIDFSSKPLAEKNMFPWIIGDMILRDNQTGKIFVRDIVSYDDFRGNMTQGYRANYSGSNGTMVIFIAQMQDNITANRSLGDMVVRAGFNYSTYNESEVPRIDMNTTVAKLPAKNPEVFAMQNDWNQTLHYVFSKKDKVYWIGFNSKEEDIPYQLGMLVEIYRTVDKQKGDFGSFDFE